ncbi:NAC domain-containing protein 86 [Capsicum chinense]|nr:NAC domain-containing protein 86 [Capsicum chinense]
MMMGDLPPGFSFDPTDEELVLYYLKSKIAPNLHFNFNNIPDLDFSSSHPWELNGIVHESKNNAEGINCDDDDNDDDDGEVELSALDEVFLSLDDDQEQDEISFPY